MNKKHFDYICIGAGSGGVASANRAALHGAKVALIESKKIGGTCVHVGCVPKKVMYHAAQLHEFITDYAPDYGIDAPIKQFNWATLVKNRQAYIDRAQASYEKNITKNGITVFQGHAKFVDKNTVDVDGEQITAQHILIATGGYPIIPSIEGAHHGIDSNSFFELNEQPKRVVIIGSGYIAVELAGVLQGLKSETHLVMRNDTPLRHFDKQISSSLMNHMEQQGIQVHPNKNVQRIIKNNDGCLTVSFDEYDSNTVQADCVIWAVGRAPSTQQLDLQKADIECDSQGYIPVDDYQTTNIPHIYALGDVMSKGITLTPVAVKAGRLLAERLFGQQPNTMMDYSYVPSAVFSHPPIGTIGMSQQEAEAEYGKDSLKIYESTFTAMQSAVTSHRQATYMKLICAGTDEKVIGLHGIGYAMDEILQGFAVAIKMGATKKDFDSCVAIHPTSAEEFVTMR